MTFIDKIAELLKQHTSQSYDEIITLIEVPPAQKMGDYAFPCFKLGKNPVEAAKDLQKKISTNKPDFIHEIKVVGPYLNFFIDQTLLAKETLGSIYKLAKTYGANQASKKKKVVVEYCSPNTNKPLHLGHLRNMAIGNAVCRIAQFYGHEVHPVEVINDRGVHICKSMLAYQKWGNNKQPNKKTDHFVGDFYVLYSTHAKEDPGLEKDIQEMLLKWEQNDPEVRALWKKMNSWVVNGFNQTFKRFGIAFEKEYFESDFYTRGKELVDQGVRDGVFEKDETGAIIAPLEDVKLPNKVLIRSNGTTIYMTQDMYLAHLRFNDFKFDSMVYVVGSEQNMHFKQLFAILAKIEFPHAHNLYHLSYGMVKLPHGRMKSREGTVVDADDMMDELASVARKAIEARHTLSKEELDERSEIIALAALKFFMIKSDPHREMTFDPEESISFEGETGPYVQYTHARACSILRKSNHTLRDHINFSLFTSNEERALITQLYIFSQAVESAEKSYKPHHVANYLISLAQLFNEFYHKHKVISDDQNLSKARLLLVDCVRQVLENGLNLLGITAPKEM